MRAVSQKKPFTFIKAFSTVLFLLFLFAAGCIHFIPVDSPAPPSQIDVERSYYPNGNLEYEAEFVNRKLDGTSRVWSENGTLLSVSEYSNGRPHGKWKLFHPNKNLKCETSYFHSQKHGYERWYYENGQLKSEKKYEYGEPLRDIIRWNPDGSIIH